MKEEQKQPTIKNYCELIEKAIDVAQSKGVYTKMDSVAIVNALSELYRYIDQHESSAVPFKAVPQTNDISAD